MALNPSSPIARLGLAHFSSIIESKFNKLAIGQLTDADWADLNSMSGREIFDTILHWEGITGYTDMILDLHGQCFTKEDLNDK